jgi:hypothetical protein
MHVFRGVFPRLIGPGGDLAGRFLLTAAADEDELPGQALHGLVAGTLASDAEVREFLDLSRIAHRPPQQFLILLHGLADGFRHPERHLLFLSLNHLAGSPGALGWFGKCDRLVVIVVEQQPLSSAGRHVSFGQLLADLPVDHRQATLLVALHEAEPFARRVRLPGDMSERHPQPLRARRK